MTKKENNMTESFYEIIIGTILSSMMTKKKKIDLELINKICKII